jgi:malonyl-CoA/methylmalonyl-CoA synthetase
MPTAAVVDDTMRARWIRDATGSGRVVVTGPDVALPAGTASPSLDDVEARDPALIVFTSGTTGAPKGAVLSHGNLLAGAEAVRIAWRWTPEDILVLALPLFHMHGLGVGLHGTLTAGAALALRPSFGVDDVLDTAAREHASLFFGVPTMYTRLVASSRVAELRPLRLCVSGSAPLAPEVHDAVAERAGQRVIERYGMTETVMNVSNPYDGERRPGSVGLPLPRVEVRLDVVGRETGEAGEILLRGPNVFAGYWHRPEATAEAFDAEGWFRSGDIGALDGDGYLRIVGRSKELIISGGYNVYPREIEDVLRAHPGVEDAAVIGVADAEWGEQVVAYIEGDAAPEDVVAFAATRLAPYKRPRAVRALERLPRNALGKVLKDALPRDTPTR